MALLRALVLVLAALLAWPACANLAPHPAVPATPVRWWAPFNDALLDSMVQASFGGPADPSTVVLTYIEWRTVLARLACVEKLAATAAQQQDRLAQLEPAQRGEAAQRDRWLEAARTQVDHWRGVGQVLLREHDRIEGTLVAMTGRSAAALRQAVLAAGDNGPMVALDVPFSMPVTASGAGSAAATLQALQAASADERQAEQLVEASRLELRSRQLRLEVGEESALGVGESVERLLADGDRLAAYRGRLAVAWARWLQTAGPAALAGRVGTADRP